MIYHFFFNIIYIQNVMLEKNLHVSLLRDLERHTRICTGDLLSYINSAKESVLLFRSSLS